MIMHVCTYDNAVACVHMIMHIATYAPRDAKSAGGGKSIGLVGSVALPIKLID